MAEAQHHHTASATSPVAHIKDPTGPLSPRTVFSPITPSQIPAQWGKVINNEELDIAWLEGYSSAQKEKQHGVILGLSQAQLQSTYAATQPHGEAWAEGYTQAVNEQMNAFVDVELGSGAGEQGMQAFNGIGDTRDAVKNRSWMGRHRMAIVIGFGVFLVSGLAAGLAVVLSQ